MLTTLDLFLVPILYWQVVAFLFGVIIGSFLNVVIYRFHTGKSLSGSSHCMSCGYSLSWFDLFPLLSFLALRGRCRKCSCRITPRYFLVELVTGLLFLFTLGITDKIIYILMFWFAISILVVITVYDLYHFIIPDFLTVLLTISAGLILGTRYYNSPDLEKLLWTIGAAAMGSAFFLLLWLVSKGAWLGFGDVKLAFPLGLLVGPTLVFSFVVMSFWVGAAISLALLGLQKLLRGQSRLQFLTGGLTMKSAVPFAPFLVASCLIILFTKLNVLDLF